MSFYSVAAFIRDNYPQYFGYQTYPIADCVRIRKVAEEWGVFCNFYATPIIVDGVAFKNAEQVFQLMKFTDPEIIRRIWNGITAHDTICHEVKRPVKSYEKAHRRPDWGTMSRGRFIVEDQTAFPKAKPDCWGVKPAGDGVNFSGPNVLGRLLMELRDRGQLDYRLPDDALGYIKILQNVRKGEESRQ